ncbi:GNAT family N-acetyltransferase [Sphingomicrobium arenosum]|uniref:GNAT family N-acetyltransferase n=1 Tax=Sphingomicrobium arenosum TaxID=2233861 RepID=UPI002240FF70|nr:GNAT family N-acetyltransferase [Sphingomicrobium arenosum]
MSEGNEVRFRAPEAEDIEQLSALGAETFRESHGDQYTAEDLDAFVSQVFDADAVRGEWEDERYRFQVATRDEDFIGYCKLGPPSGDFDCDVELKQIFVRRAAYGSGAGAGLMDWALGEARAQGIERLGLSVWEGNGRAMRFYEKHGFERSGTIDFTVGEKVETDLVMIRRFD